MFKYILLFCACSFSHQALSLTNTETTLWAEDILYLQAQVRSAHINPFHTISEDDFDASINTLLSKLDGLNEAQVEVELQRIMASIKDGHSNYYPMSGPHRHYPFRFKYFDQSLRIIATTPEYTSLLGSELVAINSRSLEELREILTPYLYGVDNQYSAKERFIYQLTISKMLYGIGVTNKKDQAQFTFLSDGKRITQKINAVEMRVFGSLAFAFPTTSPDLDNQEIGMPGITLSILGKGQSAYFDFNHYPSFSDVTSQCSALVKRLSDQNIQRLIVDFRDNGGGSFFTGLAFSSCLLQLDNIDWNNGVTVLINEGTFSAAMSNAAQFKQLLNAKLVGRPTGGDPNHYAETNRFSLPNSGRSVSVSKRYYGFTAKPSDALYPEQTEVQTWQDYQHGRDTILLELLKK
jgi:hypothetical protein